MKKLDLNAYCIQEMNQNEMLQTNGGGPFEDGRRAGNAAGKYVAAFLMMYGIYCLL